jgi:glucose/mannose-6-phosphate isomerase
MIDLNNKKNLLKNHGEVVIKSIENFPLQIKQAWEDSLQINFPTEYQKISNIVIGGMGGSRFPAYIIKELFKDQIKTPIILNDDYQLPAFVDKNSLVILSSYSGSTEEVMIMGQQALAKKAKISGITSGNPLANFLKEINAPCYVFNPINNPSNQPRIGFGYNIGGLMGILNRLKILSFKKNLVDQAIKNSLLGIKKFWPETKNNPAKQLAQKIYQKYPYFIVSEFLTGWGNALANQTNETAKSISSFRIIPELNHHLMEGLKNPAFLSKMAVFVFFYSHYYSDPIKKRFKITKEVVEQNKIKTYWYEFSGKNKIEAAFEAMIFSNYLTFYLSALYQENPTVIPYVDYFKKRLKEVK